MFPTNKSFTPEEVRRNWSKIVNFDDGRADNPSDAKEGLRPIMAGMSTGKTSKKEVSKKVPNIADVY